MVHIVVSHVSSGRTVSPVAELGGPGGPVPREPATDEAALDAPGGQPAARRTGLIVTVLAFTGVLSALMQTIVVPLLGTLPELLHTSSSNASWVVTATLLAAAATTPISGRLGDMYGKRRILIACIILLIAGSVLCALSSSFLPVVIGRTLQGSATSVIPLGISILRDELPRHKVGGAIALMSATLGIGGSVGLLLSALVAQNFDWHVLFWGAAGVGAIAMILVLAFVPESELRDPARFDVLGAIGLSVGLICLLLPITKGSEWGWTSPRVLLLGAASIAILLLWARFEVGRRHPVVDLRVSAARGVLLTNAASVMTGFAMYGVNLALPELLQTPRSTGFGLGQTMIATGLCVAPGGVAMMLVSPFSAKLSARFSPRITLITGLLVIGAGYVCAVVAVTAIWQVVLVSTVVSCGIALAYGAMPALIMSNVPPEETAAANGLNSLARSLGSAISSAVVAAVLATDVVVRGGVSVPSQDAYRLVFIVGACASVVAALVAASIPRLDRQAAHSSA
jgi:EmrB/QacA subfamily drug resistance transporter